MMKNAFYFTLKALFILKIFKFLSSRKTAQLERQGYGVTPAVMETMFSWLIMVTHGFFMVMFLYSILMVINVTIVQRKHG